MNRAWTQNAKILIVDDQPTNIMLLEHVLRRAGFANLHSTTDSTEAEPLFCELSPDIVLLDLHMPVVDGFAVLRQLRPLIGESSFLPVVVLTADDSPGARKEALHLGANDFITKPLDASEVVLRIDNLLKTRYFYLQMQEQNQSLERRVQERTSELEQAKLEILHLLARTAEYRDDETGQHTQRVGRMARDVAVALGLPQQEVELIEQATPLHDIGKIGIADEILLKPGRFTAEEFEQMKRHTLIGAWILETSSFPVLQIAGEIALTHHEKWNGGGYPRGLCGAEIPLSGRIVAIADFYDALTHERPYKKAWTHEEAIAEIRAQRGVHFDPDVVDAFLDILPMPISS
ncbi:response regulator receiver modulated metal dependent phosphohydrolase [Cohnella sp. OV330]|uniref:HD domain-containing phosphohydrolase n=1 Tax=Cohnella sp. OV330 TaxID=1855288 RepID=UPI0008EBE86E|nr:HD domain-containing phosphohydrolase [Cohnella sp. OV330]SFB55531.1 response regulator receiver modulated metal dependent phosphohydrolase [Cohnella sp. OV330]